MLTFGHEPPVQASNPRLYLCAERHTRQLLPLKCADVDLRTVRPGDYHHSHFLFFLPLSLLAGYWSRLYLVLSLPILPFFVFMCFCVLCLLIANPLVCLVRSFPLNPSPPLCSCSLLCALHPDEFSISTLSMEPGSVVHRSSEIWNQQKRRPIGKLTPPIQSEVQGPLLYFGPRRIIKMKFSFIQFWFKGELPSN